MPSDSSAHSLMANEDKRAALSGLGQMIQNQCTAQELDLSKENFDVGDEQRVQQPKEGNNERYRVHIRIYI